MASSTILINELLISQRQFFNTGATRSISFRIEQLKKLKQAVERNEERICDALWRDLHKSKQEAYLTEVSIIIQEINLHIRKLRRWAKPKKVATPIHLKPSSSRVVYEPLGVSLIIAPWNYPFQLILNPLIGSISAGNCAVIKPSPYSKHTSQLLEEIISDIFPANYISIVQGGREANQLLLKERFDIIFFTGSPELGKVVMEAASAHLTPVVLELGGKSPVIVDKTANLKIAAKRIIWGKTINAGQTCIAPDYLFVHDSIKDEFINHLQDSISNLFGKDIKANPHFGRIINDKAYDRLVSYLSDGDIIIGGDVDSGQRYISPTVMHNMKPDSDVMQHEIFGPILPLVTFENIKEPIDYINNNEKPLALYYFGDPKQARQVMSQCSSGGGCINDTIIHIANHNLPFGGVGNSGMGNYHGIHSFKAFSNVRSIMRSTNSIDLPFRYPPYKYFKWVKRLLK